MIQELVIENKNNNDANVDQDQIPKNWKNKVIVEDNVDIQQTYGEWYPGTVVEIRGTKSKKQFKIHYTNYSTQYDEWLSINSQRIQFPQSHGAKTAIWRAELGKYDQVEVKIGKKWLVAEVTDCNAKKLWVQIPTHDKPHEILRCSDNLAQLGTNVETSNEHGSHNTMYDEWINLIEKAYQGKWSIGSCLSSSSFRPRDVYSMMVKLNPLYVFRLCPVLCVHVVFFTNNNNKIMNIIK